MKIFPIKLWLIYGSSRSIWKSDDLPVVEDAALNPVNTYAKGKARFEHRIKKLEKQGFNTVILRFSNVFGGLLDHYDREYLPFV